MIKFAVRGLLARKLRTVLTALGVVLGVALVSGTYVLTDSISTAFNSIFKETYKNTDAAVTGQAGVHGQRHSTGGADVRRVPAQPDHGACPTCSRPSARSPVTPT